MSEITCEKDVQCALTLAIRYDNFFEVRFLIEKLLADVNGLICDPENSQQCTLVQESPDTTIAEYAAKYCDNPHIFDLLLQHGMNPNAALLSCAKEFDFEKVFLCLAHHADPNLRDENGETLTYNLFQIIMDTARLATLPSNMYATLGVLYNMGYKDDGDRIMNAIKQSNNPDLLDILDIYRPTEEEYENIIHEIMNFWNSYNPHKNPDYYLKLNVLRPIDEV